jgi:hypothetical protein
VLDSVKTLAFLAEDLQQKSLSGSLFDFFLPIDTAKPQAPQAQSHDMYWKSTNP